MKKNILAVFAAAILMAIPAFAAMSDPHGSSSTTGTSGGASPTDKMDKKKGDTGTNKDTMGNYSGMGDKKRISPDSDTQGMNPTTGGSSDSEAK